jgi:hypothetical protein
LAGKLLWVPTLVVRFETSERRQVNGCSLNVGFEGNDYVATNPGHAYPLQQENFRVVVDPARSLHWERDGPRRVGIFSDVTEET